MISAMCYLVANASDCDCTWPSVQNGEAVLFLRLPPRIRVHHGRLRVPATLNELKIDFCTIGIASSALPQLIIRVHRPSSWGGVRTGFYPRIDVSNSWEDICWSIPLDLKNFPYKTPIIFSLYYDESTTSRGVSKRASTHEPALKMKVDIERTVCTPGYANAFGVQCESNDLTILADRHRGSKLHKWLQYFPAYKRHLSHLRGDNVRMLEIGVGSGGSQKFWAKYFNKLAYVGIDMNPAAPGMIGDDGRVFVGDQGDADFLLGVTEELKNEDMFTIIVDDGSHISADIILSFETFFPILRPGGIYIVEDTMADSHANQSFLAYAYGLVRTLHKHSERASWNSWPPSTRDFVNSIGAVSFYDGIVFIEKVDRSFEDAAHVVLPLQPHSRID